MKITRQTKIQCATGSIEDMIDAFEDRIRKLENFDNLEMSTDIESAETFNLPAMEYKNYEDFVRTEYPEFNIPEDDMEEEIQDVYSEIRSYGANPEVCPTFWRDDYEQPIVLVDGRYYFSEWRGTEARLTPVDALYELEDLGF